MLTLAEVFSMGTKAGVDPLELWQAMLMGMVGKQSPAKEIGVPMRLVNMTLEEMTEAIGRGFGEQDSRAFLKLQLERAGVQIAVDPERLQAAIKAARS